MDGWMDHDLDQPRHQGTTRQAHIQIRLLNKMDSHAAAAVAEIQVWPLASVEHFDTARKPIGTVRAAAAAPLCGFVLKIVASLLETTSTVTTTAQRRATIAGRAFKGIYDAADPDQESPALVTKLGSFEAQMDQLEPFLTAIVEANEQARAKIKAQEVEKAELSSQLAQATKLVRQLTQQLATRTVDCLDAPQEATAKTQALSIEAAKTAVAPEATMAAVDMKAAVVSSPVESAEDEESEDDASLASDDDQADNDLATDDIEDMVAFQQYVLLEDEATMEWSHAQQAANASASSIVSEVITSEMVGCSPDGLWLLPTKAAPKLVTHIEANQGLLLVGASEEDIAKLPLEWFAAISTFELSVLERRAINMALLVPALMFWLPQFPVCPESAQKYMWFRQHLDSLMDLTEDDDSAAQEQDHGSHWSDADYLAVAAAASSEACATKDDSDVSTASEDEE